MNCWEKEQKDLISGGGVFFPSLEDCQQTVVKHHQTHLLNRGVSLAFSKIPDIQLEEKHSQSMLKIVYFVFLSRFLYMYMN